jgi:hypothetical protein
MLREFIDHPTTALKNAVHDVLEWVHPTIVMKRHDFDRPLDDLGQDIDAVERKGDAGQPNRA